MLCNTRTIPDPTRLTCAQEPCHADPTIQRELDRADHYTCNPNPKRPPQVTSSHYFLALWDGGPGQDSPLCGCRVENTPRGGGTSGLQGTERQDLGCDLEVVYQEAFLLRGRGPGIHSFFLFVGVNYYRSSPQKESHKKFSSRIPWRKKCASGLY